VARILLLLFIAFLIYLVIKGLLRVGGKKKDEAGDLPTAGTPAGEDMIACARCGVNVPRSETREVEGRRVCASNPNCISKPK
jgi:uncharacterized protein